MDGAFLYAQTKDININLSKLHGDGDERKIEIIFFAIGLRLIQMDGGNRIPNARVASKKINRVFLSNHR